MCRGCRADYGQSHYEAHRQRYIDNAVQRKRILAESNAQELIRYLSERSCSDCGESDPLVLEFDHVGEKSFAIGTALRERRWEVIKREIAKCELVCANCHRRRTARRGGFVRAVLVDRQVP